MTMTAATQKQLGATLVEVLVAIALAGVLLPTLAEAILTSQGARPNAERRLIATGLLHETLEATRVAREADWTALAAGIYHPAIQNNTWTLASGSDTVNGYTRAIDITDAQRDSSGHLVSSGGTTDPATKHISVTVSWTIPYASSVSADTYLSRWQNSATWFQTTQTDFSSGTLTNTTVVASGDGAVQLTSLGSGTFESSTFDAGANVSFNNVSFSADLPSGSTLQLQIATADTASPASWNYTGPDGTSSTYYTSAGSIPLSMESARYVRYKAFLSGSSTTPSLNDVTIGYTK